MASMYTVALVSRVVSHQKGKFCKGGFIWLLGSQPIVKRSISQVDISLFGCTSQSCCLSFLLDLFQHFPCLL